MTLPASPATDKAATARAADKTRLRRQFRTLRLAALAQSQAAILAAAQRLLPALLPQGQHLGLYWPLAGEVDLRPLAALNLTLALPAVWAEPAPPPPWGPEGLAPAGLGGSAAADPGEPPPARLLYRPWHPGEPLAADLCGIPAPLASAVATGPVTAADPPLDQAAAASPCRDAARATAALPPDALGLLLVPALAIDRQGIRLGYGGGWYDRLRADPIWRTVPALAVLPAACVVPALPRDSWDVPLDGWLDETGLHRIGDGNIAGM